MAADYTVHYMPTAASPHNARAWSSSHPHGTLAEAKEEARNYIATYPERRQCAHILRSELVAVIIETLGVQSQQ